MGRSCPASGRTWEAQKRVRPPGVSSDFPKAGRSNQQFPALEGQKQDGQQCRDREYTRLNGPLKAERIGVVVVVPQCRLKRKNSATRNRAFAATGTTMRAAASAI